MIEKKKTQTYRFRNQWNHNDNDISDMKMSEREDKESQTIFN